MTLKPEVLAAMENMEECLRTICWIEDMDRARNLWSEMCGELLAMDARMGEAERLLRECRTFIKGHGVDQRIMGESMTLIEKLDERLQVGAGK